jgi:N-acetylneuraminate lyase
MRRTARRWCEGARDSPRQVIVHVGSTCLPDAQALATQAGNHGAMAIAAPAPSYFKPRSVATLIDCCAGIARAAPETPFYFHDIPARLPNVSLTDGQTKALRRELETIGFLDWIQG